MKTVRVVAAVAVIGIAAATVTSFAAKADPAEPTRDNRTELTIRYTDGSTPMPAAVWSLKCSPDTGTHPNVGPACHRLASAGNTENPFAPVPPGTACTLIYGGPEEARVTGFWRGRWIDAEFSRETGCELGRWSNMVPVLPDI
ncbi:subtilisin inhibitor-like [Herbihabitans rhizosphaerae]|uniref:Subtilisin inhibitor-like n=1 Tax=Herbihabitans rhizosphaerae TaxID=1872711 RepID=A0A4Q7L3I4_9PSEU|nr:SSI family serine proteinase inhibitor [Herbihabitans rhizosphaerae]RZS43744.1 subtilisin inhibitor-like [Herbihabitans rhizosphaerae]